MGPLVLPSSNARDSVIAEWFLLEVNTSLVISGSTLVNDHSNVTVLRTFLV